jgi:4-hydroxy-3-methylbut-2-enyl diphosphate reductase
MMELNQEKQEEIREKELQPEEELAKAAQEAEPSAEAEAPVNDRETTGEEKTVGEPLEEQTEEIPGDAAEREEVEAQMAESMKKLRRGDIVRGTVVQVNENEVLVDIGGKCEGIIPVGELSQRKITHPGEIVQVGQEIDVFVLRTEDEEGHPVLSKKRADRKQAWEHLEEAYNNHIDLEADVVEVVKGGLLVDVGVRGFIPASLVERGYVESLNDYLGKSLRLRVIELDRTKNKVVLSRKVILDEEYERQRRETWETLEEGQHRQGIVRRLTNFGAFVDIGGVDGLLHVSELSWGRVEHPRDVLKEGQEIEVIVLGVDREHEKVSLGLKQLQPNPWDTAADRYLVGSVVTGKVLRLAPFGVFVEVEPGIEGLVHISQLADHHVAKAEDVVTVGDQIPVKVLSVDEKAQRMSLSLREARRETYAEPPEEENIRNNNEAGPKLGDLFGNLFEDKSK